MRIKEREGNKKGRTEYREKGNEGKNERGERRRRKKLGKEKGRLRKGHEGKRG